MSLYRNINARKKLALLVLNRKARLRTKHIRICKPVFLTAKKIRRRVAADCRKAWATRWDVVSHVLNGHAIPTPVSVLVTKA